MPADRTVLPIVAATLLGACISNPARGTAPTGDELRVRFDSSSGSYKDQEVVGGSTYYDSNGNAVGSVERTQAVTKHWSRTDVSFYQGDSPVDEQDYYHLAKAPGAVDEIKEARAQMSRDLTIGFPVAIVAATGSTLAAIGTFGDSAAMRYGGSMLLSVVSLGGVYLALRGLKTYRKQPLLDAERAVKYASTVERCYRGSCRSEVGGAPAPQSLSMRPTAKVATWTGTWTGTGSSTMQTKDGRSTKKSSIIEIGIEEHGETLAIALSLDLEFTDRSHKKPRVARLLGTMDATTRRTP